jgi:hypothetical protein
MISSDAAQRPAQHSVFEPAQHSLHECQNADAFRERFQALTGCPVENVAADVLTDSAEKAIFLVGSLPLGMASAGSDVDFIVVVDAAAQMLSKESGRVVNNDQRFAFVNDSNLLVASAFVTLMNGIAVEVQVAIAPGINRIYKRLRCRGPELNESEIMILGRLSRGWLLWESEGFLGRMLSVFAIRRSMSIAAPSISYRRRSSFARLAMFLIGEMCPFPCISADQVSRWHT